MWLEKKESWWEGLNLSQEDQSRESGWNEGLRRELGLLLGKWVLDSGLG